MANLTTPASGVPDAATRSEWAQEASGLFATNCVGVAGFSMLVWDHIITFGDEVEVIWKRPKRQGNGLLIYLFLILRYFAPLAYIVQLCSYFLPPTTWTTDICARYVVFEGAVIVTSLAIVALMMMIRVYALYGKDKRVLGFILALFILQFTIQGWLLAHTHPVIHPRGFSIAGCSMLFDESLGGWPTASAWLPVVYDTAIFVFTVYKTAHVLRRRRSRGGGHWIARTLLRDGALYYSAIIASNIPLIIMIAAAPAGIRNIAAQLECFVTVTMMSRITLSLRREDGAWQVGSVAPAGLGEHEHTTIRFDPRAAPTANEFKMQRFSHESGMAWTSTDTELGFNGTSVASSTGTSAALVPVSRAKPAAAAAAARPTPITEASVDEVDYFSLSPSSGAPPSPGITSVRWNAGADASPLWALTSPRRRIGLL